MKKRDFNYIISCGYVTSLDYPLYVASVSGPTTTKFLGHNAIGRTMSEATDKLKAHLASLGIEATLHPLPLVKGE